MGFGALNMLVGNLLALRQTQVKRLLAYSSLSHMGYMLLGLGIALYAGQVGGRAGRVLPPVQPRADERPGLPRRRRAAVRAAPARRRATPADQWPIWPARRSAIRWSALAFSLAVLGLGGLPPLAGFMSKWQIFVAGFETHNAGIEAAGDLRRAEQRAVAGLLCAAGERRLSPRALGGRAAGQAAALA